MFIDDLALVQALLLFAAAVLTYTGITTYWAMRQNQPERVKSALRGGAIPVGVVGGSSVVLGLWSEMVWPFPSTMAGYNILFNDIILVFGVVMVAFAATAYLNLRLEYVGVLAFMAGAVTILYGWTGYGFNYTKEPFDFLLLYLGFGAAGIAALPATIAVDFYLSSVASSPTLWRSATPGGFRGRPFGTRAVQGLSAKEGETDTTSTGTPLRYRMPNYLQLIVLAFPLFMALAAIAAWWFLGTTIPGHLTPGKTP
ncbi:MAG: DUF981 family protein [Thermoplasmata archaeon]